MISGASEKELDIAIDRADLLLEIQEKDKEIERLNNIINELESLLEYRYTEYKDTENEEIRAMAIECKDLLVFLQELKENK